MRAKLPAVTCSEDGCTSPVHGKGLCSKHYQRARFVSARKTRIPKIKAACSVDGCARPVLARGLCNMHYRRANYPYKPVTRPTSITCACGVVVKVRKDGPMPKVCLACRRAKGVARTRVRNKDATAACRECGVLPDSRKFARAGLCSRCRDNRYRPLIACEGCGVERHTAVKAGVPVSPYCLKCSWEHRPHVERKGSPCAIEGCQRAATAQGLCGMHYQRWRHSSDYVAWVPANRGECRVEGCAQLVRYNGMCNMHATRQKNNKCMTDPPRHEWTPEELQTIVTRYERGDYTSDIAADLGLKGGNIVALVRKHGGKIRTKRIVKPGPVGPDSPHYKGGTRSDQGYRLVLITQDDPMFVMANRNRSKSNRTGYVPEHRLVYARALGHPLLPEQQPHHINAVRDDNRLENLQLRWSNHGSGSVRHCRSCHSADVVDVVIDGAQTATGESLSGTVRQCRACGGYRTDDDPLAVAGIAF